MMRMKRWFGVLVVGGAALSACSEATEPDEAVGGEGGTSGAGASGAGAGSSGTGGEAAGGSGSAAAGSGGEAHGSGGEAGEGGAESLLCSDPAAVADACGCPCCWVTDCANDEPCCESFCAAGNDGAGCCGT